MRVCGLVIVLGLVAGCGKSLKAGKTPKETMRAYEQAIQRLDVGAAYDMMSKRTQRQIDSQINAAKAALDAIPDELLDQFGLEGIKDMTPREILVAAIDRAKKENPQILDQLKGLTLVVLDERNFGDRATLKVTTLLGGRDTTQRVPMVKENGRWMIDAADLVNNLPIQPMPAAAIDDCATFT